MSTQVMVTLADETYQRADCFARLAGRQISDILSEAISLSLAPLGPLVHPPRPVSALADSEVLALTELQMEPEQDRRLSELLHRQQAGEVGAGERRELNALMQVYQEGLLRKAQALNEAVGRGLRAPLES
jgi:hypothetical protein